MVLVGLLAVALIAAPAIAQNGETTNDSGPPPGETAGGSYEAPFLKEEPSLPESSSLSGYRPGCSSLSGLCPRAVSSGDPYEG
jgi:hypothetical protein